MDCSTISNNRTSNNVTFDAQSQLVENLKQELHQANLQLKNRNVIINEMELEVEKLHAEMDYNNIINNKEKSECIMQFNEKINSLQCLLEEEREKARNEIDKLREEIELGKHTVPEREAPVEQKILTDQISALQEELKEVKDQLAECKAIHYNTELENSQLVVRTKELEENLEAMKETLKMKTDSLKSTLETLEELQEEKALMSSELAMLKAGPLENKERGNSLFSEVDIKRQSIENKFQIMRSKYLQAKKVYALKNNELERLKAENRKIQMFWDEEVSNVKKREQNLLECYRRTNDELRSLIHQLELRPESPEIITVSDKDVSNIMWIHTVIEKARAEARELRKAYENKSGELLLVEENFYSTSVEIKNLKKEAIKDKARIEELMAKLAAFENPNNTINIDVEKADHCTKEEERKDSVNLPPSKTVRFADD